MVNTGLVTATLKGCGQEHLHQLQCQPGTDYTIAHAQHIGIIMGAGVLGAEIIGATGSPNALNLIGSHRDANTGTAAQNGFFASTVYHQITGLLGADGVIEAFRGIAAHIFYFIALLQQHFFDLLFQREAA